MKTKRIGKQLGRTIIIMLFLAGLLALLGYTYEARAIVKDIETHPAPGQLVDVGGYQLHLDCRGEGSPTIIVDNGAADWSTSWKPIQTELAQTTQTCLYDRAGLGWSEEGSTPRTSQQVVTELHTLLQKADIAPPYVLVGHSFGGYNIRLFTDHYPEDVVGLVLVESAHEEQWARLPSEVSQLAEEQANLLNIAGKLAPFGILRLLPIDLPQPDLPANYAPAYQALMLQSKTYRTAASEFHYAPVSAEQVAQTGSLGALPLVVVSARHSFDAFKEVPSQTAVPFAEADETWLILQQELAALSSNSTHYISETADHAIHLTDPELILQGVSHLLEIVSR